MDASLSDEASQKSKGEAFSDASEQTKSNRKRGRRRRYKEEGSHFHELSNKQQQWIRANSACNLEQRKLKVYDRQELCYWFHIADDLREKIKGSLVKSREDRPFLNGSQPEETERKLEKSEIEDKEQKSELLIEAELHVYKLLPQLDRHSNDNQYRNEMKKQEEEEEEEVKEDDEDEETKRKKKKKDPLMVETIVDNFKDQKEKFQGTTASRQNNIANNKSDILRGRKRRSSSYYNLKTNLLEVSLYQILPKREAKITLGGSSSGKSNIEFEKLTGWKDRTRRKIEERENLGKIKTSSLDKEFPLRLLDIRRIDLDSSGWETFYVKRAVEDWIKDASSNLGLVIKAKSMFDEPVRIGLIRFADLYDHKQQTNVDSDSGIGHSSDQRRRLKNHRENLKGSVESLESSDSEQEEEEEEAHRIESGRYTDTKTTTTTIWNRHETGTRQEQLWPPSTRTNKENELFEFDLNHQPILVIYTSSMSSRSR